MSFLKKISIYLIFLLISVCLSLLPCLDQLISFSIGKHVLSVHASFALCAISSIAFVVSFVKLVIKLLLKLIGKARKSELNSAIQEIIGGIFSEGLHCNVSNASPLSPIKYAVLSFFNRELPEPVPGSLKKYQVLWLNVLKRQLRYYIDTNQCDKALDLGTHFLCKYPKSAKSISQELLDLRLTALQQMKSFKFDPTKYKYDMPLQFISEYISLSYFEMSKQETRANIRKSLLEKAFCANRANFDIVSALVGELIAQKNDDKKIISIIKLAFSFSPQRNLADILLRLKRKDAFELAQNITSSIPYSNIEKKWFLCIVATSIDAPQTKFLEVFADLIDTATANDLTSFYFSNYDRLSEFHECPQLIRKKFIKDNETVTDLWPT
jgi:hypothetical protein